METLINEAQVAAIYGGSNQPATSPGGDGPDPTGDVDATATSDVEALVAEAEARGYLRGLNEAAERAMNEAGMWQSL